MSSSQLKPFFFALQYCQYWYLIIAALFFASETEMQSTLALVYGVIIAIKTTVIIIGNSFAVFFFWSRISFLKRACFLLFNLAVTDLLAGLTELMNTALTTIPHGRIVVTINIWASLSVLFSSVSLLSLLIISLERAFAVRWPFRHRVASSSI